MHSVATVLRRSEGAMRGRASIRLVLLLAFLLTQSLAVSDSVALLSARAIWALPACCLCALAATLGFCAARDLGSQSWRTVALGRVRLAGPVYAVAILAAAFALGPALTNEGVGTYLSDPQTFAYLLNLPGWPHYQLPGVFEFNDVPNIVNALVWTAPLYAVLLALACLPVHGRALRALPLIVAGALALIALVAQSLDLDLADPLDPAILLLQGNALSAALGALLGMAAYRFADRIPARGWPVLAAVAVLAALVLLGDAGWAATAGFRVLSAVAASYLAIGACLRVPPRLPGLARVAQRAERYLPGLFLFAYPLQQAATTLGPDRQGALLNAAIALPLALALAVLVWHAAIRRLLAPEARTALAADAALADTGPVWCPRRVSLADTLEALVVPLALGVLSIGALFLLYIALQPQGGM